LEFSFNKIGRLLSGPQKGWYVKAVDDREGSTGGVYLHTSDQIDGSGIVYDDWFETIEQLDNYFRQTSIEWVTKVN